MSHNLEDAAKQGLKKRAERLERIRNLHLEFEDILAGMDETTDEAKALNKLNEEIKELREHMGMD